MLTLTGGMIWVVIGCNVTIRRLNVGYVCQCYVSHVLVDHHLVLLDQAPVRNDITEKLLYIWHFRRSSYLLVQHNRWL